MRADFWFRLLNHATLALAGICLVHAEAFFFPLLPACLVPYLAVVLAAFWLEGRWVLPVWAANLLGVPIVVGSSWFVVSQLRDIHSPLSSLVFPLSLVPYTGPFLMALLAVQLFRPRGRSEFWLLQGMGLLQVTLGCVLAAGPTFGLLMAAYLASAVGCLVLRYLTAPGTEGPPPSWYWLAGFVVRFAVGGGALALAFFLVTPRAEGPAWDPFQRFGSRRPSYVRLESGFAEEINLNGTATIEQSREVAFTIAALEADGRPKLDLSPETRFRGAVLDRYDDGVWIKLSRYKTSAGFALSRPQGTLPNFGPQQFYVDFEVRPEQAGGMFVAEPVRLGPPGDQRLPVVALGVSDRAPALFFENLQSNTLLPAVVAVRNDYRYRQVIGPTERPDCVPAEIREANYVAQLTLQSLPNLEKWTAELLDRLARDSRRGIPRDALRLDPDWPNRMYVIPPRYWEAVARGLSNYLAASNEYSYSLEQRRVNLAIDPVEDFLFNVKVGHCERYASALILMLRTQGIPCRLIKGFRGVEAHGGGVYAVRQNMAHAWVEVLLDRPEGASPPFEWLTLDPTPATELVRGTAGMAEWWQDQKSAGASFWQRLIVGYNAKNQADVLSAVAPTKSWGEATVEALPYLLAVVGAALLSAAVWLRRRRGRRAAAPRFAVVAVYARLLQLLARRGRLRRAAGQTPREFAATAAAWLRGRPVTAAWADLPSHIVDLFYRIRFGGEAPDDAEVAALQARLDQLAAASART